MDTEQKMAKLKETLEEMKRSGKGFLCVGTDDPEEAAEILKLAAELNRPEPGQKDKERTREAYEYLLGVEADCEHIRGLLDDSDADSLCELAERLRGKVEGMLPPATRKVRMYETVRFHKDIEIPAADLEGMSVEEWLDEHERMAEHEWDDCGEMFDIIDRGFEE